MKRRKFLQSTAAVTAISTIFPFSKATGMKMPFMPVVEKELYEL